jgi:hypothetical protein
MFLPSEEYTADKWHQLLVVYRPNGFKCQSYIDGKVLSQMGERTFPNVHCMDKMTAIGCRNINGQFYFSGDIASILIYYRPLNPNQVKRLYRKCKYRSLLLRRAYYVFFSRVCLGQRIQNRLQGDRSEPEMLDFETVIGRRGSYESLSTRPGFTSVTSALV